MKRAYLFFFLVMSTLAVAMEYQGPFNDFVSRCRKGKLTERVSEYRAKFDDLVNQGKMYLKGPAACEFMREIASQGDFESLDLLERDTPQDSKKAVWEGVSNNANTDDANKLLVKWAKENPTVPRLFKYQPNGVQLMIEVAEDRNAPFDDRITCLQRLVSERVTTDVLDRIRALKSDKSHSFYLPNNALDDLTLLPTVGSIAAYVVKEIERRKLQEKLPAPCIHSDMKCLTAL
jgi:hypothetical protein